MTTSTTEYVDRRMQQFHDTLSERLALKDRWIQDHFSNFDLRMADNMARYQADVASLQRLIEARIEQTNQKLHDAELKESEKLKLLVESHTQVHETSERSLNEFKGTVSQRLEAVTKAIEVLREERSLFVLRDAHDTQLDALEKAVDNLERSLMERIEIASKQVRDGLDARISSTDQKVASNVDRLTKMEQNIQVMNARNQQSIIALGILLTLVEIVIRFYN